MKLRNINSFIYPILKVYWQIFKPKTLGSRLIITHKSKVLLVKHTYLKGYYLPGGGLKSNETFKETIIREVKEELGFDLSKEKLELFGIYQNNQEGKADTSVVFLVEFKDNLKLKFSNEILDASLFSLDKLPKDISQGTKRRLEELRRKIYPVSSKW